MNCFKLKMTITQSLLLNYSSLLILSLIHFFQACHANCTPSACGLISNISSPFRLKGDPNNCGDRRFQLECENNVASIDINSIKYYVKAINYSNNGYSYGYGYSNGYDTSTIRLVDASININNTCSFPIYSAYDSNLFSNNPYRIPISSTPPYDYIRTHINLMRCPHPLKNSSLFTEVTECASNAGLGYTYIKVGHLNASEVTETCRVEVIVMTSWEFKDLKNVSLSEIHHSLLYGFELTVCSWCTYTYSFNKSLDFLYNLIPILVVIAGLLCAVVSPPLFTILGFAAISILLYLNARLIFQFMRAQGHLAPVLRLAKLLHSRGFYITFVNTEFNHNRLVRARGPESVAGLEDFQFRTIPDGLPHSDKDATQDIPQLCDSLGKNGLPPFLDLINTLNDCPDVTCIISDGAMSFTLDAADRLGIPEVVFFTTSACGFQGYCNYGQLVERGLFPLTDESQISNGFLDEELDWVPGMKHIRLRDFPSFVRTTDPNDIMG